MTKLLLPLHCYDEGGRVKPPLMLWFYIAFIAKSMLILIAALTNRQTTSAMLDIFYPLKNHFYIGLMLGAFGLLIALICGFREKIWRAKQTLIFRFIKPIIITSLAIDLIFQIQLAQHQNWQFSWSIAFNLLLIITLVYWQSKSHHFKVMLDDWTLVK